MTCKFRQPQFAQDPIRIPLYASKGKDETRIRETRQNGMKMTLDNDTGTPFSRQDHQVCIHHRRDLSPCNRSSCSCNQQAAYIFRPSGQSQVQGQGQPLAERPSKRRRTSAKSAPPQKAVPERDGDGDQADSTRPSSLFVPLLNGLESAECVRLRERLFEESWGRSETRVQV